MDRMFNPWRMEYIRRAREGGGDGCVFCSLLGQDPNEAFVLRRTESAFAVLNLYPYNTGHLLIAPVRHTGALDDLTEEEVVGTGRLLQQAVAVLQEEMQPDGFNVGMNLGRVAGAGVPGHLHWHVVPRWNGDVNFMSVTGETRMLPELVEDTFKRLRPYFSG
jgi:ATP adenylyltransferase